MLQRDLQATLRARARATHDEIARLTRPLDPEQLNRRPADGGWSAGQVLEHLCRSTEVYDAPLQALLRGARADAAAAGREWRPTVFGRLLVNSLAAPRTLPATKRISPGDTPRPGVLEAFLGMHSTLATRIDDTGMYDWRALRMSSQVVPPIVRALARLNLGDVYSVFVVHAERHTRQMERVIATLA
jgi:hypothetical protein